MVTTTIVKANRVPEHVARMDVRERIAWLKGGEAEFCLTHKRRRQLKKRWAEDADGSRGPSHEVVDPKAEAINAKVAEERDLALRRMQTPRGTADGVAPCGCAYCVSQMARWPGPYVDAQPRSYECYLEYNPPAEEAENRSHGARVNKGDAMRNGLRERTAKRRWADTLAESCEGGCGRNRPVGARYCVECRKAAIAALTAAGWGAERIGDFLNPRDAI